MDIAGYGGLKLSPSGEDVLRGNTEFSIRKIEAGSSKSNTSRQARKADQDLPDHLAGLLLALKALRRDLAKARNVPAYVVFSDATLREMCMERPTTMGEMAEINGVGPKKLEDYGALFLEQLSENGAQD